MSKARAVHWCIALAWLTLSASGTAMADDTPPRPAPPTMPAAVPLRAPPGAGQVPVPDVRGYSEAGARRVLTEAGLTVGAVERVSVERLAQSLGQRYAPGVVVQQAPPPSSSGQPSWLPRGSAVALRVSAGSGARALPTGPPALPGGRTPLPSGPPPLPDQPRPAQPLPGQPLPVPGRAEPLPRGPPPLPGAYTTPAPYAAPVVPDTAPVPGATDLQRKGLMPPRSRAPNLLTNIRTSIALPCERRRSTWHLRGVGGYAFTAGDEDGEAGFYAGFDAGYTFEGCFGVDFYYRYSVQTFDRNVPGGLLEDAGGFHHLGLKATYGGSFSRTSQWTWWVGLGLGWADSLHYQHNHGSFEGFFEAGLGYMFSNDMRMRIGFNAHAMETEAGRRNRFSDGSSRTLWMVAPIIAFEIDL